MLAVEQRIKRPLAVAGGAGGRFAICTQQRHLATPLHQRERRHGRGDAAADDHYLASASCRTGIPRDYGLLRLLVGAIPHQHLPLATVALHLLHGKTGGNQAATDKTGTGKGGDGAIGTGEASETIKQLLCPHLRVLGRGETIQIPGIHQPLCPVRHLRQHILDVAKPEIEANAATRKMQAVATGDRQRPLGDKILTQVANCRPGGQRLAQIVPGQGEFLETDEVQTGAVAGLRRLFQEGLHCRQKVKACAETCFTYHETVTIVVRKSRR